jgi:hypothetical protein
MLPKQAINKQQQNYWTRLPICDSCHIKGNQANISPQNALFLQSKVVSLASNPQSGRSLFPSNRVAQLYPQTPRSYFITIHNPQDKGEAILTRVHKG